MAIGLWYALEELKMIISKVQLHWHSQWKLMFGQCAIGMSNVSD